MKEIINEATGGWAPFFSPLRLCVFLIPPLCTGREAITTFLSMLAPPLFFKVSVCLGIHGCTFFFFLLSYFRRGQVGLEFRLRGPGRVRK